MYRELLHCLVSNIKKCSRRCAKSRNYFFFLETNVPTFVWDELLDSLGFFIILMEPRKIVGNVSYFDDNPVIVMGLGYFFQLIGYN